MKISSFFFGLTFGLMILVILPGIFYWAGIGHDLFIIDSGLRLLPGAVLTATGTGIFVYCSKLFKTFGKGTPVPIEPPKEMVAEGIYKHVRNPMYLGYMAIVLGEAFIFGQAMLFAYSVAFIVGIHLYVVYFEEPEVHKRFGDSYLDFKKQVPRWIPKF